MIKGKMVRQQRVQLDSGVREIGGAGKTDQDQMRGLSVL